MLDTVDKCFTGGLGTKLMMYKLVGKVQMGRTLLMIPPAQGQPAFRQNIEHDHKIQIEMPSLRVEGWFQPDDIYGCVGISQILGIQCEDIHNDWMRITCPDPETCSDAVVLGCQVIKSVDLNGHKKGVSVSIETQPVSLTPISALFPLFDLAGLEMLAHTPRKYVVNMWHIKLLCAASTTLLKEPGSATWVCASTGKVVVVASFDVNDIVPVMADVEMEDVSMKIALDADVRPVLHSFSGGIHLSSSHDKKPIEFHAQVSTTEIAMKGSLELLAALQASTAHIAEGVLSLVASLLPKNMLHSNAVKDSAISMLNDTQPLQNEMRSILPEFSITVEMSLAAAEMVIERRFSMAGAAPWIRIGCTGLMIEALHQHEQTCFNMHTVLSGANMNAFTG